MALWSGGLYVFAPEAELTSFTRIHVKSMITVYFIKASQCMVNALESYGATDYTQK